MISFNKAMIRYSASGTLMQYFSILAIFISALGVFGLAAYLNHQRLKEICIRKVLGAGSAHLLYILSREFIRLTIIAFVIGIPLAYWLGSSWLDSFAYRTNIGMLPVLIGGAVTFLTVIIAISYEAAKSVRVSPVDKSEKRIIYLHELLCRAFRCGSAPLR